MIKHDEARKATFGFRHYETIGNPPAYSYGSKLSFSYVTVDSGRWLVETIGGASFDGAKLAGVHVVPTRDVEAMKIASRDVMEAWVGRLPNVCHGPIPYYAIAEGFPVEALDLVIGRDTSLVASVEYVCMPPIHVPDLCCVCTRVEK